MDYSSYIGSAGSAFASVIVLATYSMKTMIPLRVFGDLVQHRVHHHIAAHRGLLCHHGPALRDAAANTVRLFQMLRLVRGVKSSLS